MNRFSILKPFNVDEKFKLCVDAINFFSVFSNEEMCRKLAIEREKNKDFPLSDFDFLRFLKKNGDSS